MEAAKSDAGNHPDSMVGIMPSSRRRGRTPQPSDRETVGKITRSAES